MSLNLTGSADPMLSNHEVSEANRLVNDVMASYSESRWTDMYILARCRASEGLILCNLVVISISAFVISSFLI